MILKFEFYEILNENFRFKLFHMDYVKIFGHQTGNIGKRPDARRFA